MKIFIGSDHRGFMLKEKLKQAFPEIEWHDVGTDNDQNRVDYPIFAKRVCAALIEGKAERGILLCGSGVGVSIAANRHSGIYAALAWEPAVARAAREHDNANILALPADYILLDCAIETVQAWLDASFAGGRYQERMEMIDNV